MLINWQQRQLNLKVVYYGPALSGKTTNLEQIHSRMDPSRCSDLVSLKTAEDRTLYFDFLQLELGKVCGLTPKIHLYTVPGQSYYEESRRIVLRGADGVVFVADSSSDRLEDNVAAWINLGEHLKSFNLMMDEIPVIIQYNKRDLPDAMPIYSLMDELGTERFPAFEAVAFQGKGILDTLKAVIGGVMTRVQKNIQPSY